MEVPPKFELPKLIIGHNIGPILAANSRLLLLGQFRRFHWSTAGLMTAAFVNCLNLPTFDRNLAQYRPYNKPTVTFTMASSSESRIGRQVHTGVIIRATARYRQHFCRCCASVGPYLTSHLGLCTSGKMHKGIFGVGDSNICYKCLNFRCFYISKKF